MRRQSITGKLRTRTVDDDLADANMTRQDLVVGPYRFTRVWARLRSEGWHAKNGGPLSYDHYYIKPTKGTDDVEGEDYFYGEAALVQHALDIRLFADDDGEEPSVPSATIETSDASSPQAATGSRRSSVDSTSNGHAKVVKRSAEKGGKRSADKGGKHALKATPPSANGSTTANSNEKKRTISPDTSMKKEKQDHESGGSKQKLKRAPEVTPRQWPASHPHKGRHAADAISLMDSEDEVDGDEEKVEEGKEKEDVEVKRLAPGKRKALYVDEQEDEENQDDEQDGSGGGGGDDCVGFDEYDDDGGDDVGSVESEDFGSSSSSSKTKERPKLKTRVSTTNRSHGKTKVKYQPKSWTGMTARKAKAAPRGLMFAARSSVKSHAADETPPPALKKLKTAKRDPPPTPPHVAAGAGGASSHRAHAPRKPRVVHRLESQFEGAAAAAMKPEPDQKPPQTSCSRPASPRPRSPSADSSSHRSFSTPQSPPPNVVTRLDVDGVVFPSFPLEKYHVVITEDAASGETAITMEELSTKEQRQLVFVDICSCSEAMKSATATPQTAAGVYQAFSWLLKRDCERVAVENPPVGVDPEADCSPICDFDLHVPPNDESVAVIVMNFPNQGFIAQKHCFPMAVVAQSPRVQALTNELSLVRHELEVTKQELETSKKLATAQLQSLERKHEHELEVVQRDLEAFKKQHEQLEREYQKVRKLAEQRRLDLEKQHPSHASSHAPAPRRLQSTATTATTAASAAAAPRVVLNGSASRTVSTTIPPSPPPLAPPAVATGMVSFHAQSMWLATAFPDPPPSTATQRLAWEKIITSSTAHFELVPAAAAAGDTVVKFLKRGFYKLDLCVTHPISRRLVVVVTPHNVLPLKLTPTTVFVFESDTTNNKKHRSLMDMAVHCEVNDTMAVQLRHRSESSPLHGEVKPLPTLGSQPNKWKMQFISDT